MLLNLVGNHRLPSLRSIAQPLVKLTWHQRSDRRCPHSQRWRTPIRKPGSLANISPVRHALLRVEFFIPDQGQGLPADFLAIGLRISHRRGPLRSILSHRCKP